MSGKRYREGVFVPEERGWLGDRAERDTNWPNWLKRENPRSAAIQFARIEGQALAHQTEASTEQAQDFRDALEQSLLRLLSLYDPEMKTVLSADLSPQDMAWQHTGYVAGAVQRLLPEASFREAMAIAAGVLRKKIDSAAGVEKLVHFSRALESMSAPQPLVDRVGQMLDSSDDSWATNADYLPQKSLDIVLNAQAFYGGAEWEKLVPDQVDAASALLVEKTNDDLRAVFDNKSHPLHFALLSSLYFMHDGWMLTKVIQGHRLSQSKRYMPDLNKQMIPTQEMVDKYFESTGEEKEKYWVMILKDFDQLRAYLLKNRKG